jgi:hypothetical protein
MQIKSDFAHDKAGVLLLDATKAAGSGVVAKALMILLFEEFFVELF